MNTVLTKPRIAIIDDQYRERSETYETFFSDDKYTPKHTFEIVAIENGSEMNRLDDSSIDAFFVDAKLEDKTKGWDHNFGATFQEVIRRIARNSFRALVPPIFVLSHFWGENSELLTSVCKTFSLVSDFPIAASRYYDLIYLERIVRDATMNGPDGKPNCGQLEEERKYIRKEIDKFRNASNPTGQPTDVVLLVADVDEFEGVRAAFKLGKSATATAPNSAYISYYHIHVGEHSVIIIQQDKQGMTSSAHTVTAAILAFHPKLVAMVGFCAGNQKKGVKFGDLIIPTQVFDYTTGKINDKGLLEVRPLPRHIDTRIEKAIINRVVNRRQDLIMNILSDSEYGKDIYRGYQVNLHLHSKPMATGTQVINHPSIFEKITKEITTDCVGLDMEAYAVAYSSDGLRTPWIVIKGVQDYADGEKEKQEELARPFAAFASAKMLELIIPDLLEFIEEPNRTN